MIAIDPENTNTGAMERCFLVETWSPAMPSYNRDESLKSMRLMRQVVRNRLLNPALYGAAGAKDETGILTAKRQFAGFEGYPSLGPKLENNLADVLRLANAGKDPRQPAYAQFVQDALTAATEPPDALAPIYRQATGWRTNLHGSPGANFHIITTVQGNTFFYTSAPSRR